MFSGRKVPGKIGRVGTDEAKQWQLPPRIFSWWRVRVAMDEHTGQRGSRFGLELAVEVKGEV